MGQHRAYADDVNIFSVISAGCNNPCAAKRAVSAVRNWYIQNGLLMNSIKSDAMIIGTRAQLSKFNSDMSINVASNLVSCKHTMTSLGILIDDKLSFDKRVSSLVSSCNYHLRAFRHLRPVLREEVAVSVSRAIVMSRLDYCNALLAGATQSSLDRLQHVQNQCVRVVKRLPYNASEADTHASLSWFLCERGSILSCLY